MPPTPGDPLPTALGRYQPLRRLGRGGMGEVIQVRDGILNRNLAMKIMHEVFTSDDAALRKKYGAMQQSSLRQMAGDLL